MRVGTLFQRRDGGLIRTRTIELPAEPDGSPLGLRLVLATDIHARDDWFPRESVARLVQEINAVPDVDAVLLGGDYVGDDASAIDWSADLLSGIAAPTYAVLGNHDWWTDAARIDRELANAGVAVLTNRNVLVEGRNGARLHLAGIDSCWGGTPDVSSALAGIPNEACTVVLGHEPWLATLHDRFLHLAGHTHAGQVRLPVFGDAVARMYMPRFSQPYPNGLARRGDRSWAYTSSGVGYSTVSWRLLTPPEIVVVNL